ncbi:MAG: hypothetical protein C0600_04895 [Ignavibacteria bacterium]|nr:MAG: hypothetical protein C0600_04895 [Ignavibacteria bacterium]
MPSYPPKPDVLDRMEILAAGWERSADRKAVFLRCYSMMTGNTLLAIGKMEFRDNAWVRRLLDRFAEYYFEALETYERDPVQAPAVWRITHDVAHQQDLWTLQHLLLGVNAHINYDLVLTVAELLQDEWQNLGDAKRAQRQEDFNYVNAIIARTIDAVQDDILAPDMPALGVVDTLLGRLDEFVISRIIASWRDAVWKQAVVLVELESENARIEHVNAIEAAVINKADALIDRRWRSFLKPE